MIKEEREMAIEYFEFHRKIFCDDHLKNCPKDSIAYQATLKERTFYDMAINALKAVEEFEKVQIITGGRLNGRTHAYKCGLEDGKRKALEQQPTTQEILSHIETGITATGQSDSYCVGFCNALIWLKACITHEEPQFFKDGRGGDND